MKVPRVLGMRLLVGAAAIGLVHASFTVCWAAGGRWLLATVGAWAERLADVRPAAAGAVLSVVAVMKIAGSVVPVLVEAGRIGGRRLWRVMEWIGASVLIVYGLLNVVVGWAVLTGLITTAGGYDRAAELGHAALWDPLFLLWGLLLMAGLVVTRRPGHSSAGGARVGRSPVILRDQKS